MKNIQYSANQLNINRMIEVERQKINHIKMLDTIYKKKSFSVLKQQRQIDRERSLRIKNQLFDKERKWRITQTQINHQNTLLRSKLLQIYIPKQNDTTPLFRANSSLDNINQTCKSDLNLNLIQENHHSRSKVSRSPSNCKKAETERQITQSNIRFYEKLSNIKSDLMPRLKLGQHSKETSYFKQMLSKSSPNKNIRMRKIVEKTVNQRQKIYFPSTKSHRQNTISHSTINPQQPFIFY